VGDKGYITGGVAPFKRFWNDLWELEAETLLYEVSNPSGGIILQNTTLFDEDRDTKIQVEETSDEDVIRFDLAGVEAMSLDQSALDVNGEILISHAGLQMGLVTEFENTNNPILNLSANLLTPSVENDSIGGAFRIDTRDQNFAPLFQWLRKPKGQLSPSLSDILMVLQADGRLGINTLNPSSMLEVNGTITADSLVGDGSQLIGVPGDDLGSHTATTNVQLGPNWLSGDGADEGVFIDTTGNVGIGQGTPSTKLDVNGDISISNAELPMSLTTELITPGTPLFNISVNGQHPNVVPDSIGAVFRLDSRSGPFSPLFQWYKKPKGSGLIVFNDLLMSLNEDGRLGIGRIAVTNTLEVAGTASKSTPGDWLVGVAQP
ncbi:MAG: hypothetical protein AAFU03_18025, partial [Bacteroidota bacterium]